MKLLALAAAALFALPTAALALSFESFGNAPLPKRPGWDERFLAVANLDSRVYSLWSGLGEQPTFFYRGDARALNEAIRKFAVVKAQERRLVLLPGRGKTHSFDRRPIDFDWEIRLPTGGPAVMRAYVTAEKPRGPLDRKKAEAWLRDLDDDSFATRQAATRELGKLGIAVKPFLREALTKARPPLEVRRRIEELLARFPGRDVDDLEVPAGLTVVTAGDLLKAHLKGLAGADQTRAMSGLVELVPYSDKIVPALAARLDRGKDKYVRQWAAHYLGSVGAGARPALPALRAGLGDPNSNVRSACQRAIDQIEKARDEPAWDKELPKRRAILKDLDEWKARRK